MTRPESKIMRSSALATLHCLIGCLIGDFIGLALGIYLSLTAVSTSLLAVIFAYITGFSLASYSTMQHHNFTIKQAFRAIWLGELISIAVMEIVMISVDYLAGGMAVNTIISATFWFSLTLASIASFFAAWPVNYLLIKKQAKKCH
jgi:hypothetical protein